jgi:hypothetical protein
MGAWHHGNGSDSTQEYSRRSAVPCHELPDFGAQYCGPVTTRFLVITPLQRYGTSMISPRPRSTLEETVRDLADVSRTAEDAVAWAIKACQRRLSTPDRITAALTGRNRVRWRLDLTDAVAEVRTGVHSPLELRYLRDVERRHGLPRGDRQAVTIRRGTRQYADVRYTKYGVVVELDGVLAHPAEARKHDSRRDNANMLDGYQTLRYGWVPVAYHACAVALEVADLLRKRGWRGFLRRCGNACPVTMAAESRSLVRSGR